MGKRYDVIIIGCGVVGAAAAYELARYRLKVAILERENDVATGTTKANSAIVHAGYDPLPGTLMARLNVEGSGRMEELCARLDVPYRRCGSLVLAFSAAEMDTVRELFARGEKNGVPGLQILDADEVRRLEPNLSDEVCGALFAPSAAVVSPWELCLAMAQTAVLNGTELYREAPVTGIDRIDGGYRVHTPKGEFEARYVLNAAGLFADEVHNMVSAPAFSITPVCGQYYLLDKCEGERVGRVVFQCPNENGKGVLVAPTVHGNLIVGPDSVAVAKKTDVATTGEALRFVLKSAARAVPALTAKENIRNFAGNRATTATDDFIIAEAPDAPGFIDLAAIKSPGLSAAPAIGTLAVELLKKSGLAAEPRKEFADTRRRVHFKELTTEEKQALIARDARYGRVICRCETITEGEILDALRSPIPPVSLDGVKRRTGAGMGRCQGGFCGVRVQELIAQTQNRSLAQVEQDLQGSYLLVGRTKEAMDR